MRADASSLFEISPLVSYDGEGLEAACRGVRFPRPFHLQPKLGAGVLDVAAATKGNIWAKHSISSS